MHTVTEALTLIAAHTRPLPVEEIPLTQALHHILAEPIAMDVDSPPFDKALVDGYAVRSADLTAPAALHLRGQIDAGSTNATALAPHTCVAINTGAPIPPNADAVVMVEHTRAENDAIHFSKPIAPNANIQRRGADARIGQVVLHKSTRLHAPQLAVAATAGATTLHVHRRPAIATLATGDELVDPSLTPGPAQIRNSNSALLAAEVARLHASHLELGTARDDRNLIHQKILLGLAHADLLLITGGMSMGTKDHIPPLLLELGVELHIQKIRLRPGKPFLFGTLTHNGHRRYIAGLPGNPVSAFVCIRRFVDPLIDHLQGITTPRPLPTAPLSTDAPSNTDREFYQPALLTSQNTLTPLPWKGSADLFTLAQADALIIHPANAPARPAGTPIHYLPV